MSDVQDTLREMIAIGVPFDEIEEYLDTLPMDDEQLSALWLLAWAQTTNPAMRKRLSAQPLAPVG